MVEALDLNSSEIVESSANIASISSPKSSSSPSVFLPPAGLFCVSAEAAEGFVVGAVADLAALVIQLC